MSTFLLPKKKSTKQGQITLAKYLDKLKKEISKSESDKDRDSMRVRSMEVELETTIEAGARGNMSVYVVHGEMAGSVKTKNKITINLVSPDIIRMENNKYLLEVAKFLAPYIEKYAPTIIEEIRKQGEPNHLP